MAIDTAIKRASMQNEFGPVRRPAPDGAMGMPDRATFNWLYAGYDYTPPPPPAASPQTVFTMEKNISSIAVKGFEFVFRVFRALGVLGA